MKTKVKEQLDAIFIDFSFRVVLVYRKIEQKVEFPFITALPAGPWFYLLLTFCIVVIHLLSLMNNYSYIIIN